MVGRRVRPVPTLRPLAFPAPPLVAVTDTNALAARACSAADRGAPEDLFAALASTGRSPTVVSAHVPGELEEHLAEVAANRPHLRLADAERVLWGEVIPRVPVVDLAIRDDLHPRVRPMMRQDRELPKRLHGDVDDIGTAALAEFLAPAVILSADSVFLRFGLAGTLAQTWLPTANTFFRAAGFEANLTDTALMLEIAARALVAAAEPVLRATRRHPGLTLAALGLLGYVAWWKGIPRRRQVAAWAQRAMQAARPLLDSALHAFVDHQQARGSLLVIEPYGRPTLEQTAARHLVRRGRRLTVAELLEELADRGQVHRHEEIATALSEHPAFTVDGTGRYRMGRPAQRGVVMLEVSPYP